MKHPYHNAINSHDKTLLISINYKLLFYSSLLRLKSGGTAIKEICDSAHLNSQKVRVHACPNNEDDSERLVDVVDIIRLMSTRG